MSFTYRFRKSISLAVVFAFTFGMTVTPAEAVYDPVTGRYLQRDPNGTALLIQATMHYQGDFPMVTVSPAYELQYGDGMNFYEFIQSNPATRLDPSGLLSTTDLTVSAAIHSTLLGGTLGWMRSYATYSDKGSNWKLAGATAVEAGYGLFAGTAFGLLSGAIAGYTGVSIGWAATSVGLMTAPTVFGLSIVEYVDAQTYGERLMAGVDIGLSSAGLLLPHVAMFKLRVAPGAARVVVNRAGKAYPSVMDLRTGNAIQFPDGTLTKVPQGQRVSWGKPERAAYIAEWYQRGHPEPPGGWSEYDLHHIKPREYGGTNDFDNITPVLRSTHQAEFNAFWRDY